MHSIRRWIEQYFQLQAHGTTIGTEIRAGLTTFLTMSYILFVNPQILSQANMPAHDVAIATALASGIATLIMALYANLPFALAPGMGLNAYFTFGVVQGMGISWQLALAAVFVEGVLFLFLSLTRARSMVLEAIPPSLRAATMAGIGLFLAIIGLEQAQIVVDHPETLVTLGNLHSPVPLLALAGLILTALMMIYQIKEALLIGILLLTIAARFLGLATCPTDLLVIPSLPETTLLAFDLNHLLQPELLGVILAFLFVDFFDTAGTLMGVGKLGGFIDSKGRFPRSERAFVADATGTTLGAMLGTSTVTTYIESAAGIKEGGRTGLTALVVALLFFAALFITPLLTAIPSFATAPALIIVGILMMQGVTEIAWHKLEEALPAFLTLTLMPFTYSITHGLAAGIFTYVILHLARGQIKRIHPLLFLLTGGLLVYYIWIFNWTSNG